MSGKGILTIQYYQETNAMLREALLEMWEQFAYPTDNAEWPYQDGGLSTLENAAKLLEDCELIERRTPPKNRMYRLVKQ